MRADAAVPAASEPATLTRHRLSERAFDALAAGTEDSEIVAALCAIERSHRTLLLRAFLDAARDDPANCGPLPPVDEAWDLFVRAEHQDPGQVAHVLNQPQTGTWAARTLRRMRGLRHDDVPLWVDLGYFHSLAVAAAIRAGVPFRVTVPVRHGVTTLPTLGCARLPSDEPWETAEVWAEKTSVQITGRRGVVGLHGSRSTDSPNWRRVTRLQADLAGATLRVVLDDTDPFRHIARPARPAPLPSPAIQRWENALHDAWALLIDQHPAQARAIALGISVLVPLPRGTAFRARSASSGDAFGGVVVSEPQDATQLASALVHEFQHTKLGALLHLVDLFEDGKTDLFYAPWRDDPRPLRGLFQGVFAFFGVTGFWRRRRHAAVAGEAELAHFEFALWRQQAWHTVLELRTRPELTDLGRRFLDGIGSTLDAWQSEPVAPHLVARADATAADHRAGWRIRHLRPPEDLVRSLAETWCAAGRPARPGGAGLGTVPPPSQLRVDPSARWLDTRAVLNRLWLADRDAFRRLERSRSPNHEVAGATRADLAYVAGRLPAARDLYLAMLAEDPGRPDAWVGLGLTLAATGDHPAARTLLDYPHVARAVAQVVAERTGRPAEPANLASWLGGMPAVPG